MNLLLHCIHTCPRLFGLSRWHRLNLGWLDLIRQFCSLLIIIILQLSKLDHEFLSHLNASNLILKPGHQVGLSLLLILELLFHPFLLLFVCKVAQSPLFSLILQLFLPLFLPFALFSPLSYILFLAFHCLVFEMLRFLRGFVLHMVWHSDLLNAALLIRDSSPFLDQESLLSTHVRYLGEINRFLATQALGIWVRILGLHLFTLFCLLDCTNCRLLLKNRHFLRELRLNVLNFRVKFLKLSFIRLYLLGKLILLVKYIFDFIVNSLHV